MTDRGPARPDSGDFRLRGRPAPTRQKAMSSSGEILTADGKSPKSGAAPAVDRGSPPATATATAGTPAAKRSRRPFVLAALAVVVVVGGLYYLHQRNFEETDDAQVDGNISNIGPRVTGTVTAVYVVENQFVKANDALLEIDPTDLTVAVAQAKASVAQAEAQLQAEDPSVSITQTSNTALVAGASSELLSATAGLTGAEKDVEQLNSRLVQAEGNARLAQIEKQRGEDLWKAQAIPRADFDRRITTAETSAAEVQAARHALSAAQERVSQQ